jgi:hemolysin activation/secretion protein
VLSVPAESVERTRLGGNMAKRHLIGRAIAGFTLTASVAWTAPALAQQAPGLPEAPRAPDSLPSREQVEQPRPEAVAPKSTITVDSKHVTAAPCALDRFDIAVTIGSIKFVGPGGQPLPAGFDAILAPIAAAPPQGSQKVTVICDIRDRATAALRREGYVASVQIPPQRIENGELQLEVLSARIVEVRVRGEVGPYRKTLAARIEQLKALDPINQHDAERILLLADDIPGLDVQLTLRPAGTAPGAVIGDLTIVSRRVALLANVQNYGSRQLGRETAYARVDYFGLTGLSDVTSIGGQVTGDLREQRVLQAVHQMGIGNDGVTLSMSGTYAWSRPDLGALDLRAESSVASIELNAPLLRSVRNSIFVGGGLDLSEQRTRVYGSASGGSPLNRDRLRTAFLRLTAVHRDPRLDGTDAFYLAGRLELRKGLDILGSTKPGVVSGGYTPSRIEGKATATVIQADLDTSLQITPVLTIAGSARGQWSSGPLLNFDEFSIGNLTIGRGYNPGANSGDRAIGLRGEARFRLYDSTSLRVESFGFWDNVWLWNRDTAAIEDDRHLSSYGGGFRISLPGTATLEAIYARPKDPALLLPGAKNASDRFLLSLTTRFNLGSR